MDCLSLKEFYGLEQARVRTDVNAEVEPQMGWMTGGKPAASPTKVASDGLLLILGGNVNGAKDHARWLMENSMPIGDAVFFPFRFGFQPYYPYNLSAPWVSGLTQGLSLSLFSYIYKETGEKEYLGYAEKVFKSYLVPIEKGGFTRFEAEGPFFEEYPTKVPTRVLNGAVRAMLALHDYGVISGNSEAIDLFKKSVNRLKVLLPQYEVADKDTKVLLSAYSLAPARADVLGRFVGDGNVLVYGLKVIGEDSNGNMVELASVKIGSDTEDDVMQDVYVWTGDYMNWGPPAKKGDDWYRETNGQKGQYDHAPFIFVMPSDKYAKYGIEVDWEPEKDGRMDLQLLDGKEFHLIGSLKGGEKRTRSFFYVNDFFTSSYKSMFDPRPKVNARYLDGNLALVTILGRVTGEDIFRDYSERWKGSVGFMPEDAIYRPAQYIFKKGASELLLSPARGDKSRGLESPSVLKVDNKYYMYYSAFNGRGRSSIYFASSADGIEWERKGAVFKRQALPRDISGHLSEPIVIENAYKGGKRYLMFFKTSGVKSPSYDGIGLSYSGDGFNWTYGGKIISSAFSAKTVAHEPDGNGLVMFLVDSACDNVLLKSVSTDGSLWSAPAPVTGIDGNASMIHNVSALSIDGKLILLLEAMNRMAGRHEVSFYVYNNGRLIPPAGKNNFLIDRDWEGSWDSVRAGYSFLNDNGKIYAYFAGHPNLDLKSGGQIGRAEVDYWFLKSFFKK